MEKADLPDLRILDKDVVLSDYEDIVFGDKPRDLATKKILEFIIAKNEAGVMPLKMDLDSLLFHEMGYKTRLYNMLKSYKTIIKGYSIMRIAREYGRPKSGILSKFEMPESLKLDRKSVV